MTTTSLPVSDLIRVNTTIEPATAAQRDFGRTLMITADDNIPGGQGRTRIFSRLEDVAKTFPTTSHAYAGARAYFGQVPYPRNLVVGRYATAAAGSRLTGGTTHSTLAQLQAITAGAMTVGGLALTAINLSADASLADVAAGIQTAITTASGVVAAFTPRQLFGGRCG